MLRRCLEFEDRSFKSLSSGGSDKGLDVVVRGLEGGLASLVRVDDPTVADLADWILECVFSSWLVGSVEVKFLTRSENCSKGRTTRVYEFFNCVERPGTPP